MISMTGTPMVQRIVVCSLIWLFANFADGLAFGYQTDDGKPMPVENGRQVTVMTIQAIKGGGPFDQRLANVSAQLSQILPGHQFKLIEGRTRRITTKEAFTVKAGENSVLTIEMREPFSADGKVHLNLRLAIAGRETFESVIKTPPNQLFFLDRRLNEKDRLLIAVGAR